MIEGSAKCPWCDGTGRRVYRDATMIHGPCNKCEGTGQILAAPPLEDETRVRLQRTGSPALTWTAEKPKEAGWWWRRDMCGDVMCVRVFETLGTWWIDAWGSEPWHDLDHYQEQGVRWCGPLAVPQYAPETPTPENGELCERRGKERGS